MGCGVRGARGVRRPIPSPLMSDRLPARPRTAETASPAPASRPEPDEGELLAVIRAAAQRPGGLGDDDTRAAIERLIAGYQNRVYAICLRMVGHRETAADLTQDTLLKVILGLEGFTGEAKLSTWVIRIAMNVCLTHLRAAKVRRHESLEQYTTGTGEGPSSAAREHRPVERVEHGEHRSEVAAALDRLDPEQRGLLILRDVHDLDYERLGEVLGVPVGTVKSRLFRARLALRAELDRGGA